MFQAVPGAVAGYLFGSVAHARAHRDSDLDVAVLLDWTRYPTRRDRFDARLRLTADVSASLHRSDVDLVILNDAPLHAREIVTRGRRVYCEDEDAGSRVSPNHHASRRRSRALSPASTPREAAGARAMTYLAVRTCESQT